MSIYFPVGAYKATVTSNTLSVSSNGNPQVVIGIKIMEPLDPTADAVEQYDRTIFWTVTENTSERVMDNLRSLGFDDAVDGIEDLNAGSESHLDFAGKEIEVYCKHDSYEGKQKEQWDLSFRGGAKVAAPVTPEAVAKLSKLFGVKPKKKGNTVPQNRRKPDAVGAATSKADIPF